MTPHTNRSTNGHRFVFHTAEIEASERHYVPGEPDVNLNLNNNNTVGIGAGAGLAELEVGSSLFSPFSMTSSESSLFAIGVSEPLPVPSASSSSSASSFETSATTSTTTLSEDADIDSDSDSPQSLASEGASSTSNSTSGTLNNMRTHSGFGSGSRSVTGSMAMRFAQMMIGGDMPSSERAAQLTASFPPFVAAQQTNGGEDRRGDEGQGVMTVVDWLGGGDYDGANVVVGGIGSAEVSVQLSE